MPIVALASTKGGCGKSTTALILASAFTADGYTVHIIDADPSKRLVKWAANGTLPGGLTVSAADHTTLRKAMNAAAAKADLVIIDVEGSANFSLAIAAQISDAVIIPANLSAPDVEDAVATVALIRDSAGVNSQPTPHGLLWSRVPAAIRSREIAALESQIAESDIFVIGRIVERTAYKSLFSYNTTLANLPKGEVPGLDKANAEAAELAAQVVALIQSAEKENAA
jgi:chromosome partitioning protein